MSNDKPLASHVRGVICTGNGLVLPILLGAPRGTASVVAAHTGNPKDTKTPKEKKTPLPIKIPNQKVTASRVESRVRKLSTLIFCSYSTGTLVIA